MLTSGSTVPVLYVHAVERELGDLGPQLSPASTLALGVGKTAAAVRLSRRLAAGDVSLVVGVGVAGVARTGGLQVGDVCLVSSDRLADEGVETPEGFMDLPALELEASGPWRAHPEITARLAGDLGLRELPGRTVSTCSGTDSLARSRAGASNEVETMEGAAIAMACAAFGVPWIALRAISNYTGNRDAAAWDLARALGALHPMVLRLHRALA